MGFLDVLFGKKKLAGASREKLFALATAQVTLESELGLRPDGAAAVCYKPLSAGEFASADADMKELLDAVAETSGSRVRRERDEYGFEWVVLEDDDLEDLVTAVHLVAQELDARGFGERLLASVFRFARSDGGRVYLIYGFKRGAFWPFVPLGKGQERDNAEELALKAQLEHELPIEEDLTRWLALYGAPL